MRVVFIGTGEIGVPTLRWLAHSVDHELVGVVTQPDKPVGRDQRIQSPPIKTALGERSVPLLQPERIRQEDAIADLRTLSPDLIVVMAYGQILPRTVLEIPKVGCLNLHASLLPRHRGAAPIQAAIMAGDAESGVTVMYMDEGLDTGDILLQQNIALAPAETGQSLHDRLAEIAPAALASALTQLSTGSAPRSPQDNAAATYAGKLERDHGRIDWSEPAEVIERKIRAFHPWPGAFTVLSEKHGREWKLKIHAARLVAARGKPGEISRGNDDELIISARGGGIELGTVQLEGKWPMSAGEFARGHARLLHSAAR
ncbi:MAG TPA: methionyl-tRNA formyltransferase [Chthoniobacterales bacterium]|nr:methionyl-tRNA formyltransferase [Chthoniobacterales bacterium]